MQFNLRSWQISDLDDLVLYANNNSIAKFMTNKFPHPYTREAGQNFIAYAMSGNPVSIFAIEVNGKAAGALGSIRLRILKAKMRRWATGWQSLIGTKAL